MFITGSQRNAAASDTNTPTHQHTNPPTPSAKRIPHGTRSSTATQLTAAQRQAESDARLTKYVGPLGVTKDAYIKAVSDQAKADVAALLSAGTITQAQASARIALIDANAAAGQVGNGGHGGFGGGKGGGRGGR